MQDFFFGKDQMLRRHDYRVYIAGGFAAAQLTSDYVTAKGIRLPTRRRAYPRGSNRRPDGREEKLKAMWADELVRVENAAKNGDYDVANVTVGESIGLIRDLPRAGDVVRRVVHEAFACLSKYSLASISAAA